MPPGGADERDPAIFQVTGLFPDKRYRSPDWTLAQHGARRAMNERLRRRDLGIEFLEVFGSSGPRMLAVPGRSRSNGMLRTMRRGMRSQKNGSSAATFPSGTPNGLESSISAANLSLIRHARFHPLAQLAQPKESCCMALIDHHDSRGIHRKVGQRPGLTKRTEAVQTPPH